MQTYNIINIYLKLSKELEQNNPTKNLDLNAEGEGGVLAVTRD